MIKYTSCCFGCTERTEDCHGTCEKYEADKKKRMDKQRAIYNHLNPVGSSYFRLKASISPNAPKSKKRYR